MIASVLFWLVVAITLVSAGICASARNLFRAALALGLTLMGVAGLFLFLQAEYLAAIQVLVYVGGILVLTVFGVMMSRDVLGVKQQPGLRVELLAFLAAATVLIAALQIGTRVVGEGGRRSDPGSYQAAIAAQGLGDRLLGPYLLPALATATVLLVAMVGAVGLVRKEER